MFDSVRLASINFGSILFDTPEKFKSQLKRGFHKGGRN